MEEYRFCGCTEAMLAQIGAWTKRHLTYSIHGSLPGLTAEEFAQAIRQAFDSWQAVCGLTFSPAEGHRADILITTGRIDTAGQVLAWSELPDGSDRLLQQKYDTSEKFVNAIDPKRGFIDIVAVAAHEIGHALGLDHSPHGSPDLLAPIYAPGRRVPQPGDIQRIQRLYGPPVPRPVPPPEEAPTGQPIVIRIWGAERIEIPGYRVTKE